MDYLPFVFQFVALVSIKYYRSQEPGPCRTAQQKIVRTSLRGEPYLEGAALGLGLSIKGSRDLISSIDQASRPVYERFRVLFTVR